MGREHVSTFALHPATALQGRKKNASASGVTVAGVASAAAAAQLAEKAKKDHTHADFYRFQQREKRRNGERLDGAARRADGCRQAPGFDGLQSA